MAENEKHEMTLTFTSSQYDKLRHLSDKLDIPLHHVVYMLIDNVKVKSVTVNLEFSKPLSG